MIVPLAVFAAARRVYIGTGQPADDAAVRTWARARWPDARLPEGAAALGFWTLSIVMQDGRE